MKNLGMTFKVCYNPKISDYFMSKLTNISPSMVYADGDSAQYNIDLILNHIDEDILEEIDIRVLRHCKDNNISYIEI